MKITTGTGRGKGAKGIDKGRRKEEWREGGEKMWLIVVLKIQCVKITLSPLSLSEPLSKRIYFLLWRNEGSGDHSVHEMKDCSVKVIFNLGLLSIASL